jgi:hypothetical protein
MTTMAGTAPGAIGNPAGYRIAIDRPAGSGRPAMVVLAVALVAAFFLMIWSRTALDHNAFVLLETERRIAVAESIYWDLRLEAARLQSPERVLDAAIEMGMVYPETVRTIEVAGLAGRGLGAEERWVGLKPVLGAQP